MIDVQCEACFVPMEVPDKYAGRKVRCRECGEPVAVPAKGIGKAKQDPPGDDSVFPSDDGFPSDSTPSAGVAAPCTRGTKRSGKSSAASRGKERTRRRGLAGLWDSWSDLPAGTRTAILGGTYLSLFILAILFPTPVGMVFFFLPMVLGLLIAFFGFAWVMIEKLFRGAAQNPLGLLVGIAAVSAGFSAPMRVREAGPDEEVDTFSEFGGNIMKFGTAMFAIQMLAMIVGSLLAAGLGIEIPKPKD